MNIIYSNAYKKLVRAQTMVNWDEPEADPSQVSEFFDEDEAHLPVIREEDLAGILEDNQELGEEVVPEGAPLTEQPEPVLPEERPEFRNQYDALEWAEQNDETVRINYTTKRGTNIIRDIEPHGKFYASTTHRTILVAYDKTVGAIRAFIIRNVNNMDFLGTRFKKKFIVRSR